MMKMTEPIDRQTAIELVKDVCDAIMSECKSHYDSEVGDEVYDDTLEVDAILKCNKGIRNALRDMPPAQTELTDDMAIEHLQSTGWMQNHDKEMYEAGLRERLADDSDSYDSLIPSVEPEIITCEKRKYSDAKQISDGRRWCYRHGAYMYYCSDADTRGEGDV